MILKFRKNLYLRNIKILLNCTFLGLWEVWVTECILWTFFMPCKNSFTYICLILCNNELTFSLLFIFIYGLLLQALNQESNMLREKVLYQKLLSSSKYLVDSHMSTKIKTSECSAWVSQYSFQEFGSRIIWVCHSILKANYGFMRKRGIYL